MDGGNIPGRGTAAWRSHVAAHLRCMAAAEGEYRRFRYISPRIKAVWLAAAELLEGTFDRPAPRNAESGESGGAA